MKDVTFSSQKGNGVLKALPEELSQEKLLLISKFKKFVFVYDFVHDKIIRPRIHKANPRRHRQLIKELLSPIRDAKILDLACGKGAAIPYIDSSNEYTGLDLSEEMLRGAVKKSNKKSFKQVTFVQGDAEKMLFEDSAFDYVFMDTALHMMRNYREVIGEVARVLAKDGVFICSTPMVGISDAFDAIWNKTASAARMQSFSEHRIQEICHQYHMTYSRHAVNGGVCYFQARKDDTSKS